MSLSVGVGFCMFLLENGQYGMVKHSTQEGFLVGILPHDDLVRSGAKAAERS